jgi:hypothetical protein
VREREGEREEKVKRVLKIMAGKDIGEELPWEILFRDW